MSEKLKSIEEKVNKILEEADKEKIKCEKEYEEQKEKLAGHQKAAEEAGKAFNPSVYAKEKAAEREAADIVDLYRVRLDNLKAGALMDYAEYEQTVKDIKAELEAQNNAAAAEIMEHVEQIEKMRNNLSASIDLGNCLLDRLKYDVMREKRNAHGFYNKQYNDYELVLFCNTVVDPTRLSGVKRRAGGQNEK